MKLADLTKAQKQYLVLGVLGAVLVIGLFVVGIRFSVATISKAKLELADITDKIQRADQALGKKDATLHEFEQTIASLRREMAATPPDKNYYSWATEIIYAKGREAKLEIDAVDELNQAGLAKPSEKGIAMESYSVRIVAHGNYEQTKRFLESIEEEHPLVRFTGIEISAGKSPDSHAVQLFMQWPFNLRKIAASWDDIRRKQASLAGAPISNLNGVAVPEKVEKPEEESKVAVSGKPQSAESVKVEAAAAPSVVAEQPKTSVGPKQIANKEPVVSTDASRQQPAVVTEQKTEPSIARTEQPANPAPIKVEKPKPVEQPASPAVVAIQGAVPEVKEPEREPTKIETRSASAVTVLPERKAGSKSKKKPGPDAVHDTEPAPTIANVEPVAIPDSKGESEHQPDPIVVATETEAKPEPGAAKGAPAPVVESPALVVAREESRPSEKPEPAAQESALASIFEALDGMTGQSPPESGSQKPQPETAAYDTRPEPVPEPQAEPAPAPRTEKKTELGTLLASLEANGTGQRMEEDAVQDAHGIAEDLQSYINHLEAKGESAGLGEDGGTLADVGLEESISGDSSRPTLYVSTEKSARKLEELLAAGKPKTSPNLGSFLNGIVEDINEKR